MLTEKTIRVTSETGILKRVLIDSPGLEKVVPTKDREDRSYTVSPRRLSIRSRSRGSARCMMAEIYLPRV